MKEFNPEELLNEKSLAKEDINFHEAYIEEKSILGIDIYKYSEYEKGVYEYIPILFDSMFEVASNSCLQYEKFFFNGINNNQYFKDRFISTGDGGFLVLNDPFQALIFSMYFQMGINIFNSGNGRFNLETNLYKIIGKIELRYSITTDSIYYYKNNYYGIGIINNSRILAKDHLNRFLIDNKTLDWFSKNINSIESLSIISIDELKGISYFSSQAIQSNSSMLFDKFNKLIKFVSIQKLGTLRSKNTSLDIYNLYILFQLASLPQPNFNIYIVSLGNTNTLGID